MENVNEHIQIWKKNNYFYDKKCNQFKAINLNEMDFKIDRHFAWVTRWLQ